MKVNLTYAYPIDKYFVESLAEENNVEEQLWFVVRSLRMHTPNVGCILLQNDIIRLGQVMFQVALINNQSWVFNTALSSSVSYSNLSYCFIDIRVEKKAAGFAMEVEIIVIL